MRRPTDCEERPERAAEPPPPEPGEAGKREQSDLTRQRLRGLRKLLHDGVEHGSRFVERHHRASSELPFRLLESVDGLAPPTKVVRVVHSAMLTASYGSIRTVNGLVQRLGDVLVDGDEA